jgi:hypothetical protein
MDALTLRGDPPIQGKRRIPMFQDTSYSQSTPC